MILIHLGYLSHNRILASTKQDRKLLIQPPLMATKRFLVEERKLNLMVKYNLHQPWDNRKYRVAADAAGEEEEAVGAKHAAAGKRDDVKKSTAAAANVQKGTGDAHRGGAR